MTPPPSTAPKPFVFVLMPFHTDLREVYDLAIKPAAAECEAYAERVDEQHFTDSILDRIINQITKADALVADMTGKNPNVYYEVGYAHSLGKRVLLITQDINDIPFDLAHRPHTPYRINALPKLKSDLTPKLMAALRDDTHGGRLATPCPLVLRVNGHDIPEVGNNEPTKIQVLNYDPRDAYACLNVQLLNAHRQTPFVLDQIHLLNDGVTNTGPLDPPSQPRRGREPEWYHSAHEVDGFVRRFSIRSTPVTLPYFGADQFYLPLFAPRNENFVTLRLELLSEGRRYSFDFVIFH